MQENSGRCKIDTMREILFHNVIYVYTIKWAACITNVIGKVFAFFLLLGWTKVFSDYKITQYELSEGPWESWRGFSTPA